MIIATGGAIVAGVVAHLVASRGFTNRVEQSIASLGTRAATGLSPARPNALLPSRVREYVAQAMPKGDPSGRVVRLNQVGSMWMSADAEPLQYEAAQWIDVRRPAFVWRADFSIARVFGIAIVDSYVDGRGLLEGRAFGSVPIVKATGAGIDRSEAMRYLAELAWAPSAILNNPSLQWHVLDGERVEVSLDVGSERCSITLHFDSNGDIVRVEGIRPRRVDDVDIDTAWSGTFTNYQEIDGYRIPTRGEARWELETGTYTYWRGDIVDYTVIDYTVEPPLRRSSVAHIRADSAAIERP